MKTAKILWLVFTAFILTFSACQKDEEGAAIDTSFAETEAVVEDTYSEVDGIVDASVSYFDLGGRVAEGEADEMIVCAIKTIDVENQVITIDFGDGCEGPGGHIRKGKIIITYTNRFFTPGSKAVATFEDFYIDDIQVEGTRTRTNLTETSESIPEFEIKMEGGQLTWPDNSFATYEAEHTWTWYRASNPLNDESTWEGVSSGTTRNGQTYMVTIQTPVRFKRACWSDLVFMAVEGKKLVQVSGKPDMLIDYGDGSCDRNVTVTVNERTRTFEVKRRN